MKIAVWVLEGLRIFAKPGWRASCLAYLLQGLLKLFTPRGKRVLSNLALIYPESSRKWRVKTRQRLYNHLGLMATEVLALQRDPAQAFDWVEEVYDAHYAEEAFAREEGAIILSAHCGNWELLAAWYAQYSGKKGDHDFYGIMQDMKDKNIDRLVTRYRRNAGINFLSRSTSTFEMVKLLKSGAHIGVLPDVSWRGGLTLPFMGQPCTNSIGPAVIGLLSAVPIIPVAIYRKAPFRHEVVFFPPLQVPEETDRRIRIELFVREINTALEKIIRARPEQWFWLHNRWK